MSANSLPTIQDVVDQHMCSGCGVCAFANPGKIEMRDTLEHGRRPVSHCRENLESFEALPICPSVGEQGLESTVDSQQESSLASNWGPVLEVWEGHAADDEIRHRGSSGGVTTALAMFALEKEKMAGVLHVKARKDAPLLNETAFSTNRREVAEGCGSRYSPASPCEGLSHIETADRPSVFIGKPCDVAAAAKAARQSFALQRNLGLTIGIFCAGTPSLQGTKELARKLGAPSPEQVTDVRYRGKGWPGKMTVSYVDNNGQHASQSVEYSEGWGEILQRHRQWRCHVCPDHTGEYADISIGDPWYREIAPGEPGSSLVLVRTRRGRELLRKAREAGYVELVRKEAWVLDASQKHLAKSQGAVWGRNLALKLSGLRLPKIASRRRFASWVSNLNWKQKIQSVWGTWKRVGSKRLRSPEAPEYLANSTRTGSTATRQERHTEVTV
ncbi:MAG: Coenzyme F420 hydrogenase/dehydrogenase, beta subunit C-terminal domain [Aureliella sp.]